MKKTFVLILVAVLAVALSGVAFAADTPAKPAAAPAASAAPATPAAPAAKPAAKEPQGIKATVKGTVSSKTITRKGKDVKIYVVTVTEAKAADGKALDDLKGKPLHLGPKTKAEEFAKFDGKPAELAGTLIQGKKPGAKMLRVETIK